MDSNVIECTILGPVAARSGGKPVALGPPRHYKILAALLLNTGVVVGIDTLVCALWTQRPPSTAREQIHNGVSAIRRAFVHSGACPSVITTSFAGVTLSRDNVTVDLSRVDRLIADAQREPDRRVAAGYLRTAINLWAGPSLAGLTGAYFESAAAALEEQRLAALEKCLDHELATSPSTGLVGELTALVSRYPLREDFVRQ